MRMYFVFEWVWLVVEKKIRWRRRFFVVGGLDESGFFGEEVDSDEEGGDYEDVLFLE